MGFMGSIERVSEKAFVDWFSKNYVQVLSDLENQRQQVWSKFRSDLLNFGGAGALLGMITGYLYGGWIILGVVGLVAGLIGAYVRNSGPTKAFKTSYKHALVEPVLNFLELKYEYYPDSYVAEHDVFESELIQSRIDRINGSDYVEGAMGETEFYYSEVKLDRRKRNRSQNQSDDYSTVFKGLFFVAELPQALTGATLVIPQKNWDLFNLGFSSDKETTMDRFKSTMQDLLMPGWSPTNCNVPGSLISLSIEDEQMDELFDLYSTQEPEAQQLFTPAIWKQIKRYVESEAEQSLGEQISIKLANALNTEPPKSDQISVRIPKISISLRDKKLYLTQPLNEDLFEPSIWKANLNIAELVEYFRFLRFALTLTNQLQVKKQ
jgi:hypothetical protein